MAMATAKVTILFFAAALFAAEADAECPTIESWIEGTSSFWRCVSFLVIFYTALCCVTVSIAFGIQLVSKNRSILRESNIVER